MIEGTIKQSEVYKSPFIKIKAEVIMPGVNNGKPNVRVIDKYIVAPSAKKIATYIVNQIFGSELVTQTDGLNVNWLMPTLKKALETSIYDKEAFIYLHCYDNKVYLQCIEKRDIHDLVQIFDKFISGTIIQEFETDDADYQLHRHIYINNSRTTLKFEAFEKSKRSSEYTPITIQRFNTETGHEYKNVYILPYEVIVNIDVGLEFFEDSEKLLNGEMAVINTIADEIEKTRTRIVTSQHYQSGDIVANWKPSSTHYDIQTINVNNLADYFTLLPGDKDHQLFQFLQGDIRTKEYIETFKFYDYQCIQNAGLSPASFGYEKDAYMNVDNVDLSKNASDMTVEAIKTQIEPQVNKLFENIIKLQQNQAMKENLLPTDLVWDYGLNEKFDDMKKIRVLKSIQNVSAIPYSVKAKIIVPILNKLIDSDYTQDNEDVKNLVDEWKKETEEEVEKIKFGEI